MRRGGDWGAAVSAADELLEFVQEPEAMLSLLQGARNSALSKCEMVRATRGP